MTYDDDNNNEGRVAPGTNCWLIVHDFCLLVFLGCNDKITGLAVFPQKRIHMCACASEQCAMSDNQCLVFNV